MKKVININFQGNVIPIEESAYDILQKYSDSLRRHFAHEEGRDEIINDIETRISELFSDRLKKGATCITETDVNAIIDSMGRPEDFDSDIDAGDSATENVASDNTKSNYTNTNSKRLYRDENHKILGGVCTGISNYFGIDPVIVRIIAIVCFSVAFIPYIVLWIAVPSSADQVIGSPRKRLFRDTDNKMIAGVCSGLSQYFGVSVWIPRVISLIPFISIAFRWHHWFGWGFPQFFTLSISPATVTAYIILWILVPEAKSTSDKLEMKGEPVDLNNIKTTVQKDLNDFQSKAKEWGNDINATAKKWTKATSEPNTPTDNNTDSPEKQQFASTVPSSAPYNNAPRKNNSGLGNFAKILSYIVIGFVALTFAGTFFFAGIAFLAALPAKDFLLQGASENILAWGTFILFIWVPIIGIVIWFIRLVTKKRGGRSILRGTFIGLWVLGWICLFALLSMIGHDFSHSAHTVPAAFAFQNQKNKTLVIASSSKFEDDYTDWDDEDFNDMIRYFSGDSLRLQNINLKLIQSSDSNYHVESVAFANGEGKNDALRRANNIPFQMQQEDSILYIPSYFNIDKQNKFRNQRVTVKISIPIGKQIIVRDNSWRNSFRVSIGRTGVIKHDTDFDYDWNNNVLYIMTAEGLKPVHSENDIPKDSTNHNNNWNEDDNDNNDDNGDNTNNNSAPKEKKVAAQVNNIPLPKSTTFSMASLLLDKLGI